MNGTCTCDAASCPTGCCKNNVCETASAAACGTTGNACVACGSVADGCSARGCMHLRLRAGMWRRAGVRQRGLRVRRRVVSPRVLFGQFLPDGQQQRRLRRRGFGLRDLPFGAGVPGRRSLQRMHGGQLPERLLRRRDVRDLVAHELRNPWRGLRDLCGPERRQLLGRGSVRVRFLGAVRRRTGVRDGPLCLQCVVVPERLLHRQRLHDFRPSNVRRRGRGMPELQLGHGRQLLTDGRLQLRGGCRLRRRPEVFGRRMRLRLDVVPRRVLHRQRLHLTWDGARVRNGRRGVPRVRRVGRRLLRERHVHLRRGHSMRKRTKMLGRDVHLRHIEVRGMLQRYNVRARQRARRLRHGRGTLQYLPVQPDLQRGGMRRLQLDDLRRRVLLGRELQHPCAVDLRRDRIRVRSLRQQRGQLHERGGLRLRQRPHLRIRARMHRGRLRLRREFVHVRLLLGERVYACTLT